MRATNKETPKEKKRAKRSKIGNPTVRLLAGFLNLDMKLAAVDLGKGAWHRFQSWSRGKIPKQTPDEDRKRYEELELVIDLLDEPDVRRGDLADHLARLQAEIKERLRPIVERDETVIKGAVEGLLAELNCRQFRAQWELYAYKELMGMEWARIYDPERPSDVDSADPAAFVQQKRFKIGQHQFVVKPAFPRSAPGDVISNRLYWRIGQTLFDAAIGMLRKCATCGKYFAAYDGKLKHCSTACRVLKNDVGKSARAKESKKNKKGIKILHLFRQNPTDYDILRVLGNGDPKVGRGVIRKWKQKSDRDVWRRELSPEQKELVLSYSAV